MHPTHGGDGSRLDILNLLFSSRCFSSLCCKHGGANSQTSPLALRIPLRLNFIDPFEMSPSGKFRIHPPPPPLLPVTSTFKTDSCLVQPWKTPNIQEKVTAWNRQVFALFSRPQTWLPFCERKKNDMPYHKSLSSQMPLYFSLNGGLGTNRPGRGPIQIRPHSLHHQSTPLQHRSFSLHSQCSWSQQRPPSPSASRSLLSLLTLGIRKAPPPETQTLTFMLCITMRSTDWGKEESCTQSVWILPCCSYSAANLISAFLFTIASGLPITSGTITSSTEYL